MAEDSPFSTPRKFIIASRGSKLAKVQTNLVLESLRASAGTSFSAPVFSTEWISTEGDRDQSQALYLIGGKALWTKDLEIPLLEGEVDMLVHSLKDVPTTLPEGCVLGAIMKREDPVDSLIIRAGMKISKMEDFPQGSVIGTSSVRRVAQLKKLYPGLVFLDVRGNLDTRLAKLDAPDSPYSAIVLAKSGLLRLGLDGRIAIDLPPPVLYHAVGQGALGIEIRSKDKAAQDLCDKLTHWQTWWRCSAERAYLRVLEGGCSVPVGIESIFTQDGETKAGTLKLTGLVTAIDGKSDVKHTVEGKITTTEDAEALGVKLAQTLIDNGARALLDAITKDREARAAGVTVPQIALVPEQIFEGIS